jgi:hypothetical protein
VKSCDRRKNPNGPLNAGVKTIFRRNFLHLLIILFTASEWFGKKTTIYDYQAHKVFIDLGKVREPKRREEIEIPPRGSVR